jgi:DNA invertase Pin-like site-specific DNA recombinase
LLDRVENNGVKLVIVERADRLARHLMVSEVIIDQLKRAGVRVLTADGANLTSEDDDPTRTLIRQVLSAVAQFDRAVTALKLRAARERKRSRGERVEGRKPYGHHPAEQTILSSYGNYDESRARVSGCQLLRIADQLNAEGYRNRAGREWSPQLVYHVLQGA